MKQIYKVIQYGVYPQSPQLIKGGMEASLYGLTESLTQQAHIHVKLITYPDKQYQTIQRIHPAVNFDIVLLPNRYNYEILSALSIVTLIREVRRYAPDVCHLHGTTLLVFLLSLYLRLVQKNVVVTVHGIASVEYGKSFQQNRRLPVLLKKWVYGFVELLIINYTKKLIVDTDYVKDWVIKHRLSTCKHLLVAPQGIDDRYYKQAGITENNTIVSIGSLSERKGFDHTIRSFGQVQSVLPDANLYIIGFLGDEAYYKRLLAIVEELSLANSVHIIVDASQHELADHLRRAKVFVLHSHEESQGIVFCEAMALGKPIVATRVGGIPYVVENGVNGLLSAYGDIETFARNIIQVMTNKKMYAQLHRNNLLKANNYKWALITKAIVDLYLH